MTEIYYNKPNFCDEGLFLQFLNIYCNVHYSEHILIEKIKQQNFTDTLQNGLDWIRLYKKYTPDQPIYIIYVATGAITGINVLHAMVVLWCNMQDNKCYYAIMDIDKKTFDEKDDKSRLQLVKECLDEARKRKDYILL
jgi:hypothetical protein